MEYNCNKRNRGRRRKRRHNRNVKNNKQSHVKIEVTADSCKQKISKHYRKHSIFVIKEKLASNRMDANAFWENYNAAHEWQKRHKATWWKTRCNALEHENYVLKKTIKSLIQNPYCKDQIFLQTNQHMEPYIEQCNNNEAEENVDDENIEFHVNEDMMTFLAQSIRHKIELKNQKESELSDRECQDDNNDIEDMEVSALEKAQIRNEDAKFWYGNKSTKILAMETALQTTLDRHIDKAKPQYWPNIPLRL